MNSFRATRISFMVSSLVGVHFPTDHVGSIPSNLKELEGIIFDKNHTTFTFYLVVIRTYSSSLDNIISPNVVMC